MQSRECCGRGFGVQRVPCRGEGRGQARGKLSGSLPAATPRYGLLGALLEPGTPRLGRRFWEPRGRHRLAPPGPCNFPSLPAPGKQRGCLGSPHRSRNLSQLGACTQGLACLSRRVCVWVWVGGSVLCLFVCVCGSAGLPCPCLLSV